jgi:alkaline phosphatase D
MPYVSPQSVTRHILTLSRRGLLRGAAGLAALAVCTDVTDAAPVVSGSSFTLGVASGDPWPDGFVIWTRLAPAPLMPNGGMPAKPVEVAWEVAADERFSHVLQKGTAVAQPASVHTVHVEVSGLEAARSYFYRFRAGGEVSPVGRARTAPAAGAAPERLRIVAAGCQHYEHGFFTAWRHIAEEPDIDLVFHYGDYIYEYGGRKPGSPGRVPAVRSHVGHVLRSLDDYRIRYAQYHLDPDLQAAHAAHPFAVSFDDHEVENNWAGAFSERDGGSRHPKAVAPEVFALQKAAAFQAWYEHMPVRAAVRPHGPDITAYRRLRFGRLAMIHVMDTRSFRDDQPCGGNDGPACPEVARPQASMIGEAQEGWLLKGLEGATWQVLAQQNPIVPVFRNEGRISVDGWEAYPAARARLIEGLVAHRAANVIVLAGDIHQARAGVLRRDPQNPESPVIASEFVATSITSEGDGRDGPRPNSSYWSLNPQISFMQQRRGYTLHQFTAGQMQATFRMLPYVSEPGAERRDAAHFVVEAGRPGIMRG